MESFLVGSHLKRGFGMHPWSFVSLEDSSSAQVPNEQLPIFASSVQESGIGVDLHGLDHSVVAPLQLKVEGGGSGVPRVENGKSIVNEGRG